MSQAKVPGGGLKEDVPVWVFLKVIRKYSKPPLLVRFFSNLVYILAHQL